MRRIYLIGYMGAGKTTLGKELAKHTGLSFIDLDYYIEERFHKTVRQIFEEQGETAFRELERRMLHGVAMFEDVLISTGGGTPCFFDNMDYMNRTGVTVYLDVSVDELAKRLEPCKQTRPVLRGRSGDALRAFIRESLEQREPCYRQARFVFDAGKLNNEQDVRSAADALERQITACMEPPV